jgi:hypothetical protein
MEMKQTDIYIYIYKHFRVLYIIHALSLLHAHLPEEDNKCSRDMHT